MAGASEQIGFVHIMLYTKAKLDLLTTSTNHQHLSGDLMARSGNIFSNEVPTAFYVSLQVDGPPLASSAGHEMHPPCQYGALAFSPILSSWD